jgi:predicted MFS family arabinose efflux permease
MLTRRPQQRVVLPATLLVVMSAGVFQLMFFAVLAGPLIDDVGMSRAELGILGSINTLTGAVTAPFTGRIVDALGPARSVVGSLGLAAAGMAGLALAPNLAWMAFASVVGGVPQGSTNPATNSLISARVDPGRRGTLTGIKQSGVTMAGFIAGITLPALDSSFGWRGACWVFAGVFAVAGVLVNVLLTSDGHHAAESAGPPPVRSTAPLPSVVWWIATYGFFMGLASGAIGRFLPLFAEESLGFSNQTAGLIAALGGLFGMVARIAAARIAEHRVAPTRLMVVLSLAGATFGLVLTLTTVATRQMIWLAPPLNAIGTNAWNAVAMLAIIMFVTQTQAGRASGIVMFGFLGGIAIAGPITGWVVDATGNYRLVWIGTIVTSLVAAAIMIATDRKRVHAES